MFMQFVVFSLFFFFPARIRLGFAVIRSLGDRDWSIVESSWMFDARVIGWIESD